MKKDKKILVFYVGVLGANIDEIPEFIEKISKKLTPVDFDGTIIYIPTVETSTTRVECINPKYIMDTDLIKENERLLKKLNNEMEKQIKYLKDE